MKLMFSPASPFVRKVRMVLLETGQDDDVEIVDVDMERFEDVRLRDLMERGREDDTVVVTKQEYYDSVELSVPIHVLYFAFDGNRISGILV